MLFTTKTAGNKLQSRGDFNFDLSSPEIKLPTSNPRLDIPSFTRPYSIFHCDTKPDKMSHSKIHQRTRYHTVNIPFNSTEKTVTCFIQYEI